MMTIVEQWNWQKWYHPGELVLAAGQDQYQHQFSCSVVSDSLRPHEPQHARPPCPSPTPGVYPSSCLLSRWCHLTISSSVVPFSSCLQYFPTSGKAGQDSKGQRLLGTGGLWNSCGFAHSGRTLLRCFLWQPWCSLVLKHQSLCPPQGIPIVSLCSGKKVQGILSILGKLFLKMRVFW